MHAFICRSFSYCEAQPASRRAQMLFTKTFLAHGFMLTGVLRIFLKEEWRSCKLRHSSGASRCWGRMNSWFLLVEMNILRPLSSPHGIKLLTCCNQYTSFHFLN